MIPAPTEFEISTEGTFVVVPSAPGLLPRNKLPDGLTGNLARLNWQITSYYRETEHSNYPTKSAYRQPIGPGLDSGCVGCEDAIEWPDGLPTLGISLSGGGIRSASFSLGVLQGLNEIGVLSDVDLISAVSGGAYAAGFLIASGIEDPSLTPYELFNLIGDDFDVASETRYFVKPVAVPGMVLGAALFWIPNTLMYGLEYAVPVRANSPHVSFFRIGYGQRIRHKFLGESIGLFGTGGITHADWQESQEDLSSRGFPYVVIGTTATHGHVPACTSKEDDPSKALHERYFEISSQRVGSDGLGYASDIGRPGNELGDLIAASGSALDSPSHWTCKLRSLLHWKSGIGLNRYVSRTATHAINDFPESPSCDDSICVHRNVYLSDGGHSENLGLLPLVRRLTRHIIVVDAEHDPELMFSAYGKIKKYFRDNLGVSLQIDELERLALDNRLKLGQSVCGTHDRRDRGIRSLCERIRWQEVDDVDPDSSLWGWPIEELRKARVKLRERKADEEFFVAGQTRLSNAVFNGEIRSFPYSNVQALTLKVTYIKLAFHVDHPEDGRELRRPWNYWRGTPEKYKYGCTKGLFGEMCPFPQEPTTKQHYTTEGFLAYQELGRAVVNANISKFRDASPSGQSGCGVLTEPATRRTDVLVCGAPPRQDRD